MTTAKVKRGRRSPLALADWGLTHWEAFTAEPAARELPQETHAAVFDSEIIEPSSVQKAAHVASFISSWT